jgi:hypothetical protein
MVTTEGKVVVARNGFGRPVDVKSFGPINVIVVKLVVT